MAQALLGKLRPYRCCSKPLAQCLQEPRVCRLAVRLANDVCRRVAGGESASHITRMHTKRAMSMMKLGAPVTIDHSWPASVGEATAPVKVVAYACARCPYCAVVIPGLHKEVVEGRLAGKVQLLVRVFPIRTHESSKVAGLAFVAAQKLGHYWPFVLYAYAHFGEFTPDLLGSCAEAVGMDRAAFDAARAAPSSEALLLASKKEGLKNGVEATPTLFIDGRLYRGDLAVESLVDVLLEVVELEQGQKYL